jgi:hypothetical protein
VAAGRARAITPAHRQPKEKLEYFFINVSFPLRV